MIGDEALEKTVEPVEGEEFNQVSWRVKASRAGSFPLVAESDGARARYTVKIQSKGIFD